MTDHTAEPTLPQGFKAAKFDCAFLDASGPYYINRSGQTKIIGIRIDPSHVNYVQMAHGGVLATLADVALSFQVFDAFAPPRPVVTISLTTNFISGAKQGDWVEAHSQIDRLGRKVAYCSTRILSEDRLLMTASGAFSILIPQADS